ncbi:UPF0161 protein At3g09310 [Dendrobium catenatum]|uniref:UPF0161 protein n=1 Tax=Dendrobium catenatum TaxID=906689 RepID=A0A2I0WIX6_9ASPA|nr:UPF0161 protein At3g09310 [Dendrobium catenatum]PKU75614.1 UPF0161 protein [Dendrobium catenatum]
MSLLTLPGPPELSSSSFPGGFTSRQSLSAERREVASFSLGVICGVQHHHHTSLKMKKGVRSYVTCQSKDDSSSKTATDEETSDLGVRAALSMLKFYRSEISPILPSSCRYVPSCSVYSMEAYKKYGFVKGTILTGWRLCRCNPLGGHGFDPPRWFDEEKLTDEC